MTAGLEAMMNRQFNNMTEKWAALYVRLSRDDENEGDSNSIAHQENICQGGFHPKDEIPYKLEFVNESLYNAT